MPNRMKEILDHKQSEVENLKRRGLPRMAADGLPPPRDFKAAISKPDRIRLIAEIKFASPSAGVIRDRIDPCAIGRTYEDAGAAAISLLTDNRFFGGSLEELPRLKRAASLPILRKDFIIDAIQVRESLLHGADAILLIARILSSERLKELLALSKKLALTPLTEDLVLKMAECGADIIELGVPFSDPLLDGPTIQAASHRALQKGVGLKEVLLVAKSQREMDTPLVIMTYFNPVFRYGLKSFAKECRKSGIDGVIIPDLPPEETGSWIVEARTFELGTIFLVSPTSPPERIRWVSRMSRGFIYHVSVAGVTGARKELPKDLISTVRRIRTESEKPVAVGFGISTPEQAKEVSRFADGIIVGSAIIRIMDENNDPTDGIARVGDFVSCLAEALKS